MFSQFKVRYHLLADFPFLSDVRLFKLQMNRIGVLVYFRDDYLIDYAPLFAWLKQSNGLYEYILVNERPELIEGKSDLIEEARELGLDPDAMVDQRNNEDGLVHFLQRKLSCGDIRLATGIDGGGSITLYFEDEFLRKLTEAMKNEIFQYVSLLCGTSVITHFRPISSYYAPAFSNSRREILERDDAHFCLDWFSLALKGESLRGCLPSLEAGDKIYVDSYTDSQSLYPLLALSNQIIIAMPHNLDKFERKYQVSFAEFKKTLRTERIVPVFEERLDLYQEDYLMQVLDSAPRSILPGELRLRVAASMHNLEPVLTRVERRDDNAMAAVRESRHRRNSSENYLQTIHETAKRYRDCMTTMEPIPKAIFPMMQFLDMQARENLRQHGREIDDRSVEFAVCYRIWLYANTLGAEAGVIHNERLMPYLNVYFGQKIGSDKNLLVIGERAVQILTRLDFINHGNPLSVQANKLKKIKNRRTVVEALRELLESNRLQGPDFEEQLEIIIKEMEKLKILLSRKDYTLFSIGMLSGCLALAYGNDNPILSWLFGASVLNTYPKLSKIVELIKEVAGDPSDTLMTKGLRLATPEARLLLKITSG